MKDDKKTPPPQPEEEIEILVNPTEYVLGGGIRGEVYGCPTGLSRASRAPKKEGDQPAASPSTTPRKEEGEP